MNSKVSPLSVLSLPCLLWASSASAQSVPQGATCPTLPAESRDALHWVVLRTDSALLCRAINTERGNEAFAVTFSQKSPFKPTGSLREEQGNIQGKKLWWYRTEIAGNRDELMRETLVKLDSGQVMHVFIRTADSGTMSRYQQLVQSLDFAPPAIATR